MSGVLPITIASAFILTLATALFHRFALSKHAAAVNRTRVMVARMQLWLRPGPGWTTLPGMAYRWSRTRAALGHGGKARPSTSRLQRLRTDPAGYAVPLGRGQWGKRVYASLEDQTIIFALPRTGKTAYLGTRVVGHPGPVVVTSTKPDMYGHTHVLRARRGPVYVFDPLHVSGVASNVQWNMVLECADPLMAYRVAMWLIGEKYEGEMVFWQSKAGTALAALLYAAALGSLRIGTVYAWVCRDGDHNAEEILRGHRFGGEPEPLLSALREVRKDPSKFADSVRGTMGPALSWLASPDLAEACSPGAGDSFDAAKFVRDNGTLYMIGSGEDGPIATVFRALAEYIHFMAGLTGSRQPRGRLDPPLLMALDELTQICPVPINKWMADSGGKGIVIAAVVHGHGQLVERWGQAGAQTIMDCAGIKMMFGGITDAKTLEHMSQMFGHIRVTDGDGARHVPVVPVEVLHQLPDWWCFIIRRNLPPAAVKIQRVWKRRDVRQASKAPAPVTAVAPAHTVEQVRVLPPTVELPVPDRDLVATGNGNGQHKEAGS